VNGYIELFSPCFNKNSDQIRLMTRSFLLYHSSQGILFRVLSLIILSSLFFLTDASDTLSTDSLVQLTQTEVSLSPLSPELEDSKQILEKNNSSKTREQLYREIFGIPPPKPPRQIEASLTVNEKVDGRIEVIFSEDRTDFSIPAAPVMSMITEMISTELLDRVKSKISSSGRLTKKQLDELRLETTFESQDYLVHISIAPELLSKQVHDLKGYRDDPYIIENIKPDAVSAYLNVSVNEKLKYFQSTTNDTTSTYYRIFEKANKDIRQPVLGNIDGAINIKGAVLEGCFAYREIFNHSFQKKDVRLVYDMPLNFLRLTAGDLVYKKQGYLSYVPTGGIGISKDYSLQPHINSYPVSDREFFLNEQSEVDVWVNDVLVRSMILEPGTHDVRGFPFASGSNSVKIEIRDFSGRIETLDYTFIHEPALLAKGKSVYTCNIGVPSQIKRNEYIYHTEDPYFVAAYKRGLTHKLTLGGYGQAFIDRMIAGTDGIYALSPGNIHLDLAGSYTRKEGPDIGAKLGFFYRSKVSYSKKKKGQTTSLQRINPLTWNTDIEYIGADFPERLFDSLEFNKKGKSLCFSTDLSIPMPGQFNVNLRSAYKILPDSNNVFETGVGFQKTLFRSLRAGATLSYTSDIRSNRANPFISVNVHWTFISGPNSFSVNETVTRQPQVLTDTLIPSASKNSEWGFNTDVQWDYLGTYQRPEKINAGITAHVSDIYSEYNGRIGYSGNGGSIEFNQNLATPGYFQAHFIQHQSDLTLKSSLAFVNGTFALSRPVYSEFMIAKGVKNLKGSTIRINPHDDDYDATSTWFGPAVLPLHSPYLLQKIKLSPLNSSVASVNDKMDFTLYPQYKSGFLIKVGTDITVLVIGTLLDKSGNTLNYQSISITSKDNNDFKPINTFTNQAGKFQFMGTAGQTYEMRLDGSSAEKPISITIPEDKNDFYRVGDINTDISSPELPDSYNGKESFKSSNEIPDTNKQELPQKDSSATVSDSDKQLLLKRAAESERGFIMDSVVTEEVLNWDTTNDNTFKDSIIADPDNVIDKKDAVKLVDPKAKVSYVFGTLRDSSGTPMPFTSFDIIPVDDSSEAPIRSFTNKDGRFQFICSKPARYRISATASLNNGSFRGVDTFMVTAASMGSYQQTGKLSLNKSEETALISGTDKNSIKVTGAIEDNDGKLLKFTPVSFISIDTTINTFTDNEGSFQIVCRKPGKYMIYLTGSRTNTGAFININTAVKGIVDVGRQRIELY
jgi:outer membrane usher protein